METQVDTTQRKNETKQSIKIKERPYGKRTHDYEMIKNDKKEDIKQKSYHLPQIGY
jgi:hypothetical protein